MMGATDGRVYTHHFANARNYHKLTVIHKHYDLVRIVQRTLLLADSPYGYGISFALISWSFNVSSHFFFYVRNRAGLGFVLFDLAWKRKLYEPESTAVYSVAGGPDKSMMSEYVL